MNTSSMQVVDYEQVVVNNSRSYLFLKRFFDIVLSFLALIPSVFIFVIVSFCIVIEDGFPVFFIQKRTGKNGKVFKMFKFRSMCKNAPELHVNLLDKNEMDGPTFKMKEDPRVTKVGRFIRKTSIDELPQLINIIKGDMSIVGPRPLPTYETEQCSAYQNQRLLVKPGLTCYWQCSGRNDIPFEEWMEMDLKYIEDMSIWTDIKIILKTFVTIFGGDGAY